MPVRPERFFDTEQGKTQAVRLLDVVLIGPLMTVGGLEAARCGRRWIGYTLAAFGIATMIYNGRNHYLIALKRGEKP